MNLFTRRRVRQSPLPPRCLEGALEALEDRTLLSNVTVSDIQTGLAQLGPGFNQVVSAADVLGNVPIAATY